MLTKSALKKFGDMLNTSSYYGILPLVWDEKTRSVSVQTSKWQLRIFNFFAYAFPIAFAFIWLCISIDIFLLKTPISALSVNLFFSFCGGVVSLTPPFVKIYHEHFIPIANRFQHFDRDCREYFTKKEMKKIQVDDSLLEDILNLLIPLEIIVSICVSCFFFNPYDPYRRYIYFFFEKILGLDSIIFQIPFVFCYFLDVRILMRYLCWVAYSMILSIDCTYHWLQILSKHPCIFARKKRLVMRIYLSELILNRHLNNFFVYRHFGPIILALLGLGLVLTNFMAIKSFASGDLRIYLLMPLVSFGLNVGLYILFSEADEFEKRARECVLFWGERKKGKYFQKYFNGFLPLRLEVGVYFNLNRESSLPFASLILMKTMESVVM